MLMRIKKNKKENDNKSNNNNKNIKKRQHIEVHLVIYIKSQK